MSGPDHLAGRGSAVLETVAVLPLLILLLGCVFDFGRAVNDRALLQEAGKVAARTAARSRDHSPDTIERLGRDIAEHFLAAAGYDSGRYRINVQLIRVPVGMGYLMSCVKVTISADGGLSRPFLLPSAFAGMTESATFRLEQVPLTPLLG